MSELRRRAEELVSQRESKLDGTDSLPEMLHELQVHEIELALQNEELLETQEALRQARDRYFDLFDLAPVGYVVLDPQGLILEVNNAAAVLLGRTRRYLLHKPLISHVDSDSRSTFFNHLDLVFNRGAHANCELSVIAHDGERRLLEVASTVEAGEPAAVCRTVLIDITERRRLEGALLTSERRLALAVDTTGLGILEHNVPPDEDTYHNDVWLRLLGREQRDLPPLDRRMHWSADLVHPEDLERINGAVDAFVAGDLHEVRELIRLRHRDGGWRHFHIIHTALRRDREGRVTRQLGVMQDVTSRQEMMDRLQRTNQRLADTLSELREAQAQLIQQERLAAVGQLAAGIAHDFNNLMATVVLFADLMLETSSLSRVDLDRVTSIREQGQRAADLTQQILDFSRRSVLRRQRVDAAVLLRDTVALLERTLPADVAISFEYELRCAVHADSNRLRQALVNLAVNAREAMPDGGTLKMRVERWVNDAPSETGVPAGVWVRFLISDNGEGMSSEIVPRIFEPFFTTRSPHASGLGLAQVYGIVKQHEGHIEVESRPGGGTLFAIYLPALEEAPAKPAGSTLRARAAGDGELILVAEDNPSVRAALSSALELLNYRVLSAADGREALALFARQAEDVALVITDLVMPEMGGVALLKQIHEARSDLPALVVTGYPLDLGDQPELSELNVHGTLHKPVTLTALGKQIAQALGKTGAGAAAQ